MTDDLRPPYRLSFDNARDPYAARNALGVIFPLSVANGGTGATTPSGALANLGGGSGNVSTSGTPAANDVAQWATSTTIKGVALNTWRTDPNFFNILTVKSAVGGDGVGLRGLANQGWVYADGASTDVSLVLSSKGNGVITLYNAAFTRVCAQFTSAPSANTFPTFTGGVGNSTLGNNPAGNPIIMGSDLQLTTGSTAVTQTAGDNSTKIATTAFVTAAGSGSGSGSAPPQGRLTLQTLTPVMTTTQSAKTTIFYTPYVGNKVPIYDGTNMVMTTFAELSVATTDTTKSPAAIGVSKVNDWFVWSDAGTVRIGHGPDWTSDTARSAGTALVMVNGILLNNASITNGPAASRGTYVGTTRSNASSQLDWIFGGSAAGGTRGVHYVWNMYNRHPVNSTVNDTTASEAYTTTTWKSFLSGANNSVDFVSGMAEDFWLASGSSYSVSTGNGGAIGIGYDVTNAPSGAHGGFTAASYPTTTYSTVSLGKHTVNFIMIGDTGVLFYGNTGTAVRDGFMFTFLM